MPVDPKDCSEEGKEFVTTKKLTKKHLDAIFAAFRNELEPVEKGDTLWILTDSRTGAQYCECHISGRKLVEFATTDVPLDPEDQAQYRANRQVVADSYAFKRMIEDAKARRSFSNIVTEYTKEFDARHPLKVIGGQHRIEAIRAALKEGVDEDHGVKVYLNLTKDQRLDVQLISNTNIAISGDLFDRLQETARGPQLRDWCQGVGLLPQGQDFADRRNRGGAISVQIARTFITNFYLGMKIDPSKFDTSETLPVLCPSGEHDESWDALKGDHPVLWKDKGLHDAAREFARLIAAQRAAFLGKKPKPSPDFPEKAMNPAVLAAWAYVAGMLQGNKVRLARHYELASAAGRDPLNATALAKGKHKTDPENYRGLGYRTDTKERGRLVELFYAQAEDGKGISPSAIDVAIKKYHAKQAQLEVLKAQAKGNGNV
jgi:hypothetical protein